MQSIVICKRVGGHLHFEAEGIGNIFQNSKFDPKIPIGILSLVGEQSDPIFIELLVKQLQDNSEFFEPLVNTTKPCKHTVATNDKLSRVTLWPEAFSFKSTIVLLLRVSYSVEDPEFDGTDNLEMFLSLASSTILEVSMKKSEPRFRPLHEILLALDKKFEKYICKNILQHKNLNRLGIRDRRINVKPGETSKECPTSAATKINWALGSTSPKIFTDGKHDSQLFESNLEEFFIKCIEDCQYVFTHQNESGQVPLENIENILIQQQATRKSQASIGRSNTHTGVVSSSNTTFLQSTVPSLAEAEITREEVVPPKPKPRSKIQLHESSQLYSSEDRSSFEIFEQNYTGADNNSPPFDPVEDNQTSSFDPEKDNSTSSDPKKDNSTPDDSEEDKITPPDNPEIKDMLARGFNAAAEIVLKKMKLKATKHMLKAVNDLVTESQKVLDKALGSWDINNTNFRFDNMLQNVIEKSSINLPKLQKLGTREQKWVREQAQEQLIESNCDLGEIEKILSAFVAKNVEASDANALRILINLNVLKSKTLKGDILQNEYSRSFLLAVCNNIFMKFVHRNKHTDIFLISVGAVRNFGAEEFKRYVEVDIYSKGDIRKIVDMLVNRCASSIAQVMSWHFNHDLTKSEKVIASFCKKSCSKQISDFKKQNSNNIVKHHNKLSGIIEKSKSMYDEKIVHEVAMKVSLSKLKKVHEKERSAAIKSLHKRIKQGIRENEPIEIHEKTLTAEIDTAWKLLSGSYKG